MKHFFLALILFATLHTNAQNNINYNTVSQDLLQKIMDGKSYKKEVKILEKSTLRALVSQLKTDSQKIAFWVNIYNSFIQISLTENPKEYQERSRYFKSKRICIAGETLSFDDIEHAILRKSRIKLSWGYLRKYFRPKWERRLRVKNIDWRIHFALNCGAKSCPPVAKFTPENLDSEFNFMTRKYLNEQTSYTKETKTATTVSLFSWFRADFGGISGARKILANYKITPEKPKNLNFKTYDWTLSLRNFREIPK
jgi:hypothetical protein